MKKGEIVIYQAPDGRANLDVRLENDTVWLDQYQMAELFNRERSVVSKHIINIFKEGELPKESNVQKMHIAHSDKPIALYSLDVIISVGYRVKSLQGTQFRIWANKILKEYLVKGYIVSENMKLQQYSELKQTRCSTSISLVFR